VSALFKIVWTDGYNREMVAEYAEEENLSYVEAEAFCAALRDASTWDGNWWEVRPQNARLWRGMEEFV
jgi:hypothetical protein